MELFPSPTAGLTPWSQTMFFQVFFMLPCTKCQKKLSLNLAQNNGDVLVFNVDPLVIDIVVRLRRRVPPRQLPLLVIGPPPS